MSNWDRALRRQAVVAAGIFVVVVSVVAYQRLHQVASLPTTNMATTQVAAEPEVPTVVVTARRDPAIREVAEDRETASARRLAARSLE
jgi:hypothetical protein